MIVLYNRFEQIEQREQDAAFSYSIGKDTQNNDNSVGIMMLNTSYLDNEAIVQELNEYFHRLQMFRSKQVPKVVTVLNEPGKLFAVVYEVPQGVPATLAQLSELDKTEFIDQLCDLFHALNVKGIFHGMLQARHLFKTETGWVLSGFGYGVMCRYGWRGDQTDIAPELSSEVQLTAQTEIYSLASFIDRLFPEMSNTRIITKAKADQPDGRQRKIREFQAQILRFLSHSEDITDDEDKSGDEQTTGGGGVVVRSGRVRLKYPNRPVLDEIREKEKQKNKGKDRYLFTKDQFVENEMDIPSFVDRIKRRYFDRSTYPVNNLDTINRIIQIPGFYEVWYRTEKNPVLSGELEEFEQVTQPYRQKQTDRLNQGQLDNIVVLNRKLLEKSYPNNCPKLIYYPKPWRRDRIKYFLIAAVLALVFTLGYFYNGQRAAGTEHAYLVRSGTYNIPPHIKRYIKSTKLDAVNIDEDFYVENHEVTVAEFSQYAKTLSANERQKLGDLWKKDLKGKPRLGRMPVGYVSLPFAQGYARWLSGKSGSNMQLPNLRQWIASVILYGEKSPVIERDSPAAVDDQNASTHLIGNLREWSMEKCGENRFILLGEDYMTSKENIGVLPCVNRADTQRATGFRLIRLTRHS